MNFFCAFSSLEWDQRWEHPFHWKPWVFFGKGATSQNKTLSPHRKNIPWCAVSSSVRYKKTYDVLHIHHSQCGFFVPRHCVVAHFAPGLLVILVLVWMPLHRQLSICLPRSTLDKKEITKDFNEGPTVAVGHAKIITSGVIGPFWRKPRSMLLVPKMQISATLRCKKRGVVFVGCLGTVLLINISRWSITRIFWHGICS